MNQKIIRQRKPKSALLSLLLALSIFASAATTYVNPLLVTASSKSTTASQDSTGEIVSSIEWNNNVPFFTEREKSNTKAFESYSKLDSLGRCGVAYANICQELMPTEKRGSIGRVKPSGWHTVKYSGLVDGNYLYNRCHLIGYQLAGENANKKNLITGTRYLNVEGMLPYENEVADYVESTNNHVLYRVTPYFEGKNLVASGVFLEAYSVEDQGKGVEFCVYCPNVQPGITIDYSDGSSKLDPNYTASSKAETDTTTTSESAVSQAVTKQESVSAIAPTPAPTTDTSMVWLSATGKCYHSINNCGTMNPDKAHQVTKSEAEAEGKKPCSKCY